MEKYTKINNFFRKLLYSIFGIDKYDKISESLFLKLYWLYNIIISISYIDTTLNIITRTEVGAMEAFKTSLQSNLPDFKVRGAV